MFETATLELAKRGRWNDAAFLANELYKFQPTNSAYYHILAPLMVARSDNEGYRSLCREIMTRFSNTTNHHIADQMAKDCLILPASGVDLNAVAVLADVAVTRGSNSSSAPYFKFCKAFAEFRLGHDEEATKWAKLAHHGPYFDVKAEAAAIVAMCQFKLNHLDEAQAALADCDKLIETKMPTPEKGLGDSWRDWIVAQALQSEAKRMIKGASATAAASASVAR